MTTFDEKLKHNQHCREFICCQKCDFHAKKFDGDGIPEFVMEDEGYLWCPNEHRLFSSSCENCEGKYTQFCRNKNRILCLACDYPVYIFKLPLLDNFDFLGDKFDMHALEREICCGKCSNSSLREFQIIPIDNEMLSVTCHRCDLEQIVVPKEWEETGSAYGGECSGGQIKLFRGGSLSSEDEETRPKENPTGCRATKEHGHALAVVPWRKKPGFFSKLKAVSKPVFKSLLKIGTRTFKPVAKLALGAVGAKMGLGAAGLGLGFTAIDVVSHFLEQLGEESDDGDRKSIEQNIIDLLPFLEEKGVEQVLKMVEEKSATRKIKDH